MSEESAGEMYFESFNRFRTSADYLLNRSAPNSIGQKDLETGIRIKNTAIASMFLFNNNIIRHPHPDPLQAGSKVKTSIFGRSALYPTEKYFDLLTALKIVDMYKNVIREEDKATYYLELSNVVFDQFLYEKQDIKNLLLLRAHIKSSSTAEWRLIGNDSDKQVASQLKDLLWNSEEDIKKNYKNMFGGLEPYSLYMDAQYLKEHPHRKQESLKQKQKTLVLGMTPGHLFKQSSNEEVRAFSVRENPQRLEEYLVKMPQIKNKVMNEIKADS